MSEAEKRAMREAAERAHARIQEESPEEHSAYVRHQLAQHGQEQRQAQATPAPLRSRDDWWQQGGRAATPAAWSEWQGGGESPAQAGGWRSQWSSESSSESDEPLSLVLAAEPAEAWGGQLVGAARGGSCAR